MTHILFVCTGNTCRSPMAEAILKSKADSRITVKSAGIFAGDGSDASAFTKEVLKEKGISCDHESSFLTPEMVKGATFVLTMTNGHKQEVIRRFPDSSKKVFTLKEFAEESGDVSDPYGGSIDIYRETYEELEALIERVVRKIT